MNFNSEPETQVNSLRVTAARAPSMGNVPVREAAAAEIRLMSGHVLWFYQRGQPVVLWISTRRLTLAPLTLPAGDVILLQLALPAQAGSSLNPDR